MNDNAYKNTLFANANAYYNEAADLYAVGRRDDAHLYQMHFDEAFKKIRALGWDKEFMGIA